MVALVAAGINNSRSAFVLAANRFVSKLKHSNLELAQELSAILPSSNSMRGAERSPNPVPVDSDSRMQLVESLYPVYLERQPVFSQSIRMTLDTVLREWTNLDVLIGEGLMPARMLLFSGAPGVGKTLAAHWLAQELKLPLLTLNLATVMSSYLGKTGNNLKAVFEHAMSQPCVLLLDEFDAIAKRRDDNTDVGELKRLVNVLLQALDNWPADSLLVAATNHGELLDPAVWRRFDHALTFEQPSAELIAEFLSDLAIPNAVCMQLANLLEGQSFSAISQLVLSARKTALLEQRSLLSSLLQKAITSRMLHTPKNKTYESEMLLMYLEGKSRREIASHFGKTHPTVSSVIKRYLGE